MSNDDTGIVVRPPGPGGAPRGDARGGSSGGSSAGSGAVAALRKKHLAFTAVWMMLGTGVGAGAIYLAMRQQLDAAEAKLAVVTQRCKSALDDSAAAKQQAAATAAELTEAKAQLAKAAQELEAERSTAAAAIAAKETEAKALETKLQKMLAGQGEVSQSGGAIKLEVVDKVLFSLGQSELSERGKGVLAKVGAALAELPDKQIWVQGHTDDQPITPDKGVKPTFPSNWELASARALSVVHYLQDTAKIEPSRLAAVAFGQYRPLSRNKAKNRRIEIVLYPKIDVKPR